MKRNVRLIAVFLIAVQMFMLCDSCFALSTNESFLFKPVVIPLINNSVKQWMNTPKNRATFTVLMAIEIDDAFEGFDGDAALANTSYIGNYNSDICVGLNDNEHSIFALYNYLQEEVTFIVTGYGDSDILNRPLIEKLCGKCYENDLNEINDVLLTVKTAIDTSQGDKESNFINYEPILLTVLDLQIEECYADSVSRARFSMLLASELNTHLMAENKGEINLGSTVFNPSYIGRKNSELLIYIDDDTHKILIAYDFLTETVSYKYSDSKADDLAAIDTIKHFCDSYYMNDSDDLLDAVLEVSDASQAKRDSEQNEQAVKKAKQYLDTMAFSYNGLIHQLEEYEKFTASQAKYGADRCGANWNEQAVKKAKSYLKSSSNWTKSRLISQLEYNGFTSSEASYGVNNCGKSW